MRCVSVVFPQYVKIGRGLAERPGNAYEMSWRTLCWEQSATGGDTDMGDAGKRDKGKREEKKAPKLSPKEKKQLKREKKKK